MASHLRRFGILLCPCCAVSREFVAYDPQIAHITDAMCVECGWVFGRVDQYDEFAGMRPEDVPGTPNPTMRRKVPVVSDAQAAAAARALARDARELSDLPDIDPPFRIAREAGLLLPAPPAPWRPGLHSTPTGAPATAPSAPPAAARPDAPAAPRSAPPDVGRARSEEFMRHFRRERSNDGRS